jgi:hypothetical protein
LRHFYFKKQFKASLGNASKSLLKGARDQKGDPPPVEAADPAIGYRIELRLDLNTDITILRRNP